LIFYIYLPAGGSEDVDPPFSTTTTVFLEKIGYDKISFITNTALLLHSYAYNDIYEGLTPSKKDA